MSGVKEDINADVSETLDFFEKGANLGRGGRGLGDDIVEVIICVKIRLVKWVKGIYSSGNCTKERVGLEMC